MFLPEVTNRRSPTTFAPVVRPTSCWIEPRYSTFFDITASWTVTADAGRRRRAPRCRQAGAREVTSWRLQRWDPLRLAACEFVRGTDEGSDSCWTEDGSPRNLRR